MRLFLLACLAVLSVALAADAGPFARMRANRQARRHPQPAFAAPMQAGSCAGGSCAPMPAWRPQLQPQLMAAPRLRLPSAAPAFSFGGGCPGGVCGAGR